MSFRRASAHGPSARPQHHSPVRRSLVLGQALVALLLVLVPAAAALPAGGSPASGRPVAADRNSTATLSLTSVTPGVLKAGSSATITGTIGNTGTAMIVHPVVHVSVLNDPLDTRDRVDEWGSNAQRFDDPKVVATVALPQALAPREFVAFTVTVPAAKLPYRYNLASLPTTLTVTEGQAITEASTRASVRTYLEWVGNPVATPIQVGWVVPLTLPADPALFGPSGQRRTDAWRRAIGPDSPIDQTIKALDGQPVTWLVDPSMLEPPGATDDNVPVPPAPSPSPTSTPSPTSSTPSTPPPATSGTGSGSPSTTGSSTARPTGTEGTTPPSTSSSTTASPTDEPTEDAQPQPVTVTSLSTELRNRLAQLAPTQPVWFLPYADPDVSALSTAGGTSAMQQQLDRPLSPELRAIGTTVPLWPAAEVTSTSLSGLLKTWRTTTGAVPPVLLSSRQLTGEPHRATENVGQRLRDGTPVLAYDEPLSDTATTTGGDSGIRTQRFLAETLATYQQQPSRSRSLLMLAPRTGQATPAQLEQLVSSSRRVPWLRPVSANGLLTQARSAERSASIAAKPGNPKASLGPSPLTAAGVDQLRRNRNLATDIGTILTDSQDISSGWDRALDEVGSTRWRGNATAYSKVVTGTTTGLDSISRQVAVRRSTINFFASSGTLSVTVVNNLDRPVHDVQLYLRARKPQLKIKTQPRPISLQAGGRVTIRVPVTGLAAGQVPVDAVLQTPTGTPLGLQDGKVVQLKVNVRPTATWLFWVLGIVAGLVFVVGLFRSLRRGPRAQTAMPLPDDVPEPHEGDDD
ncbi:DUF6049 family protein [Luteipulveratus mongoliensis]|uniref:Uncharacterized protein n=1 Tax=Luteipulveratus mongoliensis TaxID=571913 RepID=A0A0K1JEH8_9MICO|nr:DUF6049 family protein [Luteipulveratus mongoliensis]AKU14995.1 hypothetical protein VV02_02490 [Luteipulveratus mongoliensis]